LPRGRAAFKVYDSLSKQMQAEWQLTKGMETHMVLEPFPLQLRGDVLNAVYQNLIEVNPPFLRCSDQMRRQILGLLRPAVALKKSNVITSRMFTGTIYILIKGTLQVSQSPDLLIANERTTERTTKGDDRASKTGGKSPPGGSLKRSNTKNFKDKLKVRMLEKPGAVIPPEDIYYGAKASVFTVFAVTRCQMLTLESGPLRGVLQAFPAVDANLVKEAFEADYKNLADSLKMTKGVGGRTSEADAEPPAAAAKRASVQ